MKLDEKKLQEVVEKIAYQQFGQEQIDDLYAKMGILNEYVQEQLRLFAVVGRSEALRQPLVISSVCTCTKFRETPMINGKYICSICNKPIVQTDL